MKLLSIFSTMMLMLGAFAHSASGSNLVGGEITWELIGQDTFLIKTTVYGNCKNSSLYTVKSKIISSCGQLTLTNKLTSSYTYIPICEKPVVCSSSLGFTVRKDVFSALLITTNLKKSNCCNLTIESSTKERSPFIKNIKAPIKDTNFLFLKAQIDICQNNHLELNWENTGPKTIELGKDFEQAFKVKTNDTTDSIVYSFTQPFIRTNKKVKYTGSYDYNKPLYFLGFPKYTLPLPRGLHLNRNTGLLQFRPMVKEKATIAIKASIYRNKKKIGETTTEFATVVDQYSTSNSKPVITGINGSSTDKVTWCHGAEQCFFITLNDNNAKDSLSLDWTTDLPGDADIIHRHNGRGADTIEVCWTPDTAKLNKRIFTLNLTGRDNACYSGYSVHKTISITIGTPRRLNPDIVIDRKNCDSFRVSLQNNGTYPPIWTINGAKAYEGQINFNFTPGAKGRYIIGVQLENCYREQDIDTIDIVDFNRLKMDAIPSQASCTKDTFTLQPKVYNAGAGLYYKVTHDTSQLDYFNSGNGQIDLLFKKSFSGRFPITAYAIDTSLDKKGCSTMVNTHIMVKQNIDKSLFDYTHCEGSNMNKVIKLPRHNFISGWTGPGVINDIFDASRLSAYGIYDLSYFAEDTGVCVYYSGTVKFAPTPNVHISTPSFKVCQSGNNRVLKASPSGGQWTNEGHRIDSIFRPKQFTVGTHYLQYKVIDSNYCSNIDTLPITILDYEPPVSVPEKLTVCGSDPFFTIKGFPRNGNWLSSDFTVSGDSINVLPSLLDWKTYLMEYKFSDSLGCTGKGTTELVVTAYTKADFRLDASFKIRQNDTLRIINRSVATNPTDYTWQIDGPASLKQKRQNAEIPAADTGVFNLRAILKTYDKVTGCSDELLQTATMRVLPYQSVGSYTEYPIRVYPNPASSYLTIEFGKQEEAIMLITDIHGKVVLSDQIRDTQSRVNLEALPAGIYFLNIIGESGSVAYKIQVYN